MHNRKLKAHKEGVISCFTNDFFLFWKFHFVVPSVSELCVAFKMKFDIWKFIVKADSPESTHTYSRTIVFVFNASVGCHTEKVASSKYALSIKCLNLVCQKTIGVPDLFSTNTYNFVCW